MALTVGAVYTLTDPNGIGVGFGAIPSGTRCTVVGIHEQGEAGVGDHGEDAVVLEFTETQTVLDPETYAPKQDEVARRFSVSISAFNQKFQDA